MKLRMMLAFTAMACVIAFAHAQGARKLVPNKDLKGELVGKTEFDKKATPWLGYNDSFYGYMTDIEVKLRAEDKITIKGKVSGAGRKISMALLDPAGKMIAATERNTHVGSAELTVDEVSSTGTYKIRIVSDGVGVFTINADFPENLSEEDLVAQIADLRKQLAALEKQLKELRDKKK